jgi:hypothetical protein
MVTPQTHLRRTSVEVPFATRGRSGISRLSSCTRSASDFSVAFTTAFVFSAQSSHHPDPLSALPLFPASFFKFSCLRFHRHPFSSTSSSARVPNELGHTPPAHAHVCPTCFSGIKLRKRRSEVAIVISAVELG